MVTHRFLSGRIKGPTSQQSQHGQALRVKHNAAARALLRAGFGPAPAGTFALEGAVKPEERRAVEGINKGILMGIYHVYMFQICFRYVSYMFHICFIYVSDMFHILVCFIYGRIWACIYIYLMKYVEQECN